MPNVHIWVRKEDWNKWQALADKPDWLHEHLNMPKFAKHEMSAKPVPKIPDNVEYGFVQEPKPNLSMCEHFQRKGQCLVKTCKFGRGK